MNSVSSSHRRGNSASPEAGRSLDSPRLIAQPHSSADLYALRPHLSESRPGTSMSTMSGSADDNLNIRNDSYNSHKRASVLSFQTAMSRSAGYTSNDEKDQMLEKLDDIPPIRPWLHQDGSRTALSSYSSSPDDRNLPGGWKTKPWEDPSRSPRHHVAGLHQSQSSSQSPKLHLSPLDDPETSFLSTRRSLSPPPQHASASIANPTHTPHRQNTIRPSDVQEKQLPKDPHSSSLAPVSAKSPESGVSTLEVSGARNMSVSTSAETMTGQLRTGAAPSNHIKANGIDDVQRRTIPPIVPVADRTEFDQQDKDVFDLPPELPDKKSPPLPAKEEVGLSSPPLSEDILPATLPVDVVKEAVSTPIPASKSPVSDFRVKPLVQMQESSSDIKKPYDNSLESPKAKNFPIEAGIGAHAAKEKTSEPAPAFAALMQNGVASHRTAIPHVEPSTPLETEEEAPSIETPPREPSPPPEGEVEARAEWEKAQLRQITEESKTAYASRKTTFRGQLKPLQLVTAEEAKRVAKIRKRAGSTDDLKKVTHETLNDGEPPNGIEDQEDEKALRGSPRVMKHIGVLSTQQLQRQSARDQRRSANAINLAAGVSEIGGAYPVFTSPPVGATKTTGDRQYPGLMPQRSLVPPFELQNRPDGLPSGLIGPDGVRRNPNDPDVCLECMMRDEDMIDIHVIGPDLWERESDRDFRDACRIEAERVASSPLDPSKARVEGSNSTHGENSTLSDGYTRDVSHKLTKIRVKRVANGDPLTTERLKLHTQMNPPASSHRWRTLQAFLATQAKYIANEQRARNAQSSLAPSKLEYDNRMVRAHSNDSKRNQNASLKLDERSLTPTERLQKEKDIALAREVRRRNAASAPMPDNPSPVTSTPRSRVPSVNLDNAVEDLQSQRASTSNLLGNENSSGHHSIPRRTNQSAPQFARAGSAQDLRANPPVALKSPDVPPSPSSSLAPPSAPFRASTPQTFGKGIRARSSTLSLANSGSMIDMHVGTEDRREHHISQAGFIPGTPLHTTSPSAFNKAYYGFPGDGEAGRNEEWNRHTDAFDTSMQSKELDSQGYNTPFFEGEKKSKKTGTGLRGFFNKLSGKDTSMDTSRTSRPDAEDSSLSIDRRRRISLGADVATDLQKPPPIGGFLSKARRSTSSLLYVSNNNVSGRPSMDSTMMLSGDRSGLYMNPPGMSSQTSLEMGPFGTGPQPPPRRESRDPNSESNANQEEKRHRTISTGTLFGGKRKMPNLTDLPVSSKESSPSSPSIVPTTANRPSGQFARLMEVRSVSSPAFDRNVSPMLSSPLSQEAPRPSAKGGVRASMLSRDDGLPRISTSSPTNRFDTGRPSMQLSTSNQNIWPQQSSGPLSNAALQGTGDENDAGNGNTAPPKRPPRSPFRGTPSQPASETAEFGQSEPMPRIPDLQRNDLQHKHGASNLHVFPTGTAAHHQRNASNTKQDQSNYQQIVSDHVPTTPTSSRKSRLLKLPFGRSKRESLSTSLTRLGGNNGSVERGTPSLRSRSSRGTFDDSFNMTTSSSFNGLQHAVASGRKSMSTSRPTMETDLSGASLQESGNYDLSGSSSQSSLRPWLRQRRSSNQIDDRSLLGSGLPPRSRSALGTLDAAGLVEENEDDIGGPGQIPFGYSSPVQESAPVLSKPKRSFLPRLRTNSRIALRSVDED